jgi:hypothetical protein
MRTTDMCHPVFETELLGIDGVKQEAVPQRPTIAQPEQSPQSTEAPTEAPTTAPTTLPVTNKPTTSLTAASAKETATQNSPVEVEDNGECHLLGPYALLVQGALGLLAVSSLVYKRWRETPRRPLKIWFFDVSKQVFGSVLLHLANILMSMLSSGGFDVDAQTKATPHYAGEDDNGKQPNPCSFYLLNIAVDVSFAIAISETM